MKYIKLGFLLTVLSFFIVGCTPPSMQVMPPLTYQGKIHVHSDQHAVLVWKPGKMMGANFRGQPVNLAGAIVLGVMNHDRSVQNTYYYGKAQQVVFMTSLKNILVKHAVFKQVDMGLKTKIIDPRTAIFIVHFLKTRVGSQDNGYPIILNVRLTLLYQHKRFTRRFFVTSSQNSSAFGSSSFAEHQTEVSKKLLNRIIRAIQDWHKHLLN